MAVLSSYQLRQLHRILLGIIDIPHQTVLKGYPPAGLCKIERTGLHQLCQGIRIGNRHQLPSLFVRGRMQGKSKRNLQFILRQFPHLWHDPAGRYGQIPLTDVQPILIRKQGDKPQKILIIIQRFPGSHNHHIGNSLPALQHNCINLIQHFRGKEISL